MSQKGKYVIILKNNLFPTVENFLFAIKAFAGIFMFPSWLT